MTAKRRLVPTPPLRFGDGRECTFPASLAVATGVDYDWLMGCSGAAFTATIDREGWDPLAATPRDPGTLALAARAAGVRLDNVPPPFDDDLRPFVLARIEEALDEKLLPVVRGIGGPPEFGLIVGCDGTTIDCQTFFDRDAKPTRVGWDAFRDEDHGGLLFLDRLAEPHPRALLAREALDHAVEGASASRDAILAWIGGLRDDARWTDPKHAGSSAFADHAMRATLCDRRRAAARFLRGLRAVFPDAPGADLIVAAESYGHAADAVARGGLGPFDAGVAVRFQDVGRRRGLANFPEKALEHESAGLAAIADARAHIR